MWTEKELEALKVTTAVDDKHLGIESKKHRMKTAQELRSELNSSPQQPVSLTIWKLILISGVQREHINQETPLMEDE